MASASSSLSEEFKCPIHLDELVNPKIMGPCFHTACLDCVVGLVRASERRGVFSCPICREDCRIPVGGVQNLKDNFQIKSIMDRYRNVQENTAGIKCIACGSAASHFCKKCESIFVCPSCARKHDLNPDTSDHELIGICKEHGKTLSKFCRGCNEAICSVCRISTHSGSGSHEVTSHYEAVNETTTRVKEGIMTLEEKLKKKERHREGLQKIHDSAVEKIASDLITIAEKAEAVFAICDRKHKELSSKRRDLLEHLKATEKDLSETEKMRTDVRNTNEEYCRVLRKQRNIRLAKLKASLAHQAKDIAEVQRKIDLARTVTSSQRVFDDKTVSNLVHVSEELQKLPLVAELEDGVNPFLGIENEMVRFVPGNDDLEIGSLVGKFLIPEYTSIEKVANLSYPPDRPCRVMHGLKHRDDGCVVSLYRSGGEIYGDTMCLYDAASPERLMTITRDIGPGVAITITSTGEIMVLRRTEPAVRAFNMDTGTFRNISVCIGDELVDQNWGVEIDDEGNIFVLNGSPATPVNYLLVFNTKGNLIHDEIKVGWASRMAYCRSKRILYIAINDKIVRYRWNGSMLNQMSSLPLVVKEFFCWDVSIGSAGEVFVSGIVADNHEIRIYQVMEAEDDRREDEECGAGPGSVGQSGKVSSRVVGGETDETIKMIRINFGDNITRQTYAYPCISVKDNTLVLGYDSKIEVYKLF